MAHYGLEENELTTETFNPVVQLSSWMVKLLALVLVVMTVGSVTISRLEELASANPAWQKGYISAEDRTRQLECLTRNIYWEAASEPFEGKVAVAQVTLNRVESGKWADSVCGVVYQKNIVYEKVVCQFSWYCEGTHRTRPVVKAMWNESEEVAKKVLLEGFRLPSLREAYYYHADYVNPNWRKPKITTIGRHIFYGEKT